MEARTTRSEAPWLQSFNGPHRSAAIARSSRDAGPPDCWDSQAEYAVSVAMPAHSAAANCCAMDHQSFCDQLVFSIGFAISRNRGLLRRLLGEHVTDATREHLAKRMVEHLEICGFEVDEVRQIIRKRDHARGW
jgi:hypothetical protein